MTEETQQLERIDRRKFLGLAWAASAAALLIQGVVGLFDFLKPRAKSGGFGGEVAAGLVEEFPPGTVRHVPAGQFYVSHLEGVGLIAMWHRCTHLGCTVPWREELGLFNCPCHSSIFSPSGEVVDGPAPRPLDLFSMELVDGEVIVDTGKTIRRQQFEPSQALKV